MAPQGRDLIQSLSADSNEVKLRAVRSLKNEIIGSQYKKQCYLDFGAVPKIVQLLASQQEKRLTVQAAATLGSFAYGNNAGVKAVVDSGGVSHLLKTLSSDDEKVVEAVVRSLKMIFQSDLSPKDVIFTHPAFDRLVRLLQNTKKTFAEDVAMIFSKCCQTNGHQQQLMASGALSGMARLLVAQTPNRQAAALEALLSMSQENGDICRALLDLHGVKQALLTFTRDTNPRLRLMASAVLTNISRTLTKSVLSFREEKRILQVLRKLLEVDGMRLHVPDVLANLTSNRTDLQRAAHDIEVAKKLCNFLSHELEMPKDFRTGILRALATICRHLSECRKQIVDSGAIVHISASLESPFAETRAAAAFCIQNMTSTVSDLNYDWVHGSIPPLILLLSDPALDVQINACGAFCNLLYEISLAKSACIDQCLGLLVEMTQNPEPKLVHHAAFALKNLTYQLPTDRRFQILREFPWSHLKSLLSRPDTDVQQSALTFLQNVCSSDSDSIQAVIEWSQGELLEVLFEKLSRSEESPPEIITTALKVVSNISTGTSEHQDAVIATGLPSRILDAMRDKRSEEIRAAAVFCVINLIWRDELPLANEVGDKARNRAAKLREIGIEAELKTMQGDESLDVRERVRTTIGFFNV